jgi:signal peptidase I
MEPTIPANTHAIGYLSSKYRNNIKRFDIAIYNPPHAQDEIWGRRVIGMPGEHIRIDENGVVVNGVQLVLPACVRGDGLGAKKYETTIPPDSIFTISDNTQIYADSRYFGPVPIQNVIGRFPFKR